MVLRPRWCDHAGVTRLLIVDDNAGFRGSARALLEAGGFTIVGEAATGEEGIAAVAALRPEAVLLDVQLPDLDGFEVAQRLRAANGGVRIVLTSSRGRDDYGELVTESPVQGFIAKDELSPAALRDLLR
jgi:DNA-binding NarL/FixJ family response regulator